MSKSPLATNLPRISPFEQQVDLKSFSSALNEASAGIQWHSSAPVALHAQINSITERIESLTLRAVMLRVFYDLARLIEYLRMIDLETGALVDPNDATRILMMVGADSRDLLSFIKGRAITAVDSEQLFDTLDGVVFAIEHELNRVFFGEFRDRSPRPKGTFVIPGKLNRVRGMLCNCLQQGFITIARVFDPFVDGAVIFNDVQLRQERSLVLLFELTRLIELSKEVEGNCDIENTMSLLEKLEQFRGSTMQYLMYKDWEDFEREIEVVQNAATIQERAQAMGAFVVYLETLLGHVSMRACLKNTL